MTGGLFFYELHKYLLIVFVLLGIILDRVRLKGYAFLIYIGLLLLSILFTTYNYTDEVRRMIAFNLAGPVSLGFVAFYFYKKKVTFKQLQYILFVALLPVISLVTYLFLYTPSIKDTVTGTASNFATSGGFGPNQVSTILGVGIFILFARLLLNKFKGTIGITCMPNAFQVFQVWVWLLIIKTFSAFSFGINPSTILPSSLCNLKKTNKFSSICL